MALLSAHTGTGLEHEPQIQIIVRSYYEALTPSKRLILLSTLCAVLRGSSPDARIQLKGKLHLTDPAPSLQLERYGQLPIAGGLVADRVSYATDYGLRVPALVYHSAERHRPRRPGVILAPNPHGSKASDETYRAAISLARSGAVVLAYDQLGQLERNHLRLANTAQLALVHDPDLKSRLTGLMARDALQAVAYLCSRKDVDRRRIAIVSFAPGTPSVDQACTIDKRARICLDNQVWSPLFAGHLQQLLRLPNPVDASVQSSPAAAQQLALPEAQWCERSNQYLFETWLAAAESAVRMGAP